MNSKLINNIIKNTMKHWQIVLFSILSIFSVFGMVDFRVVDLNQITPRTAWMFRGVNFFSNIFTIALVALVITLLIRRKRWISSFIKLLALIIFYQFINIIISITSKLSVIGESQFTLKFVGKSIVELENYHSFIKLAAVGILIALVFNFFILERLNLKNTVEQIKIPDQLIWTYFIFVLFTLNSYFLMYLTSHTGNVYLLNNQNLRYFWQVFLALIVVYGISYIIYKGLRDLLSNKPSFSLVFVSSAILGMIFEMGIQYTVGVDDTWTITPIGQYIGWFVLFLLFFLIYALINRFVIATMIIVTLFTSLTIGSFLKYQYRGEPVFVTDLEWLKNIKELAGFVNSKLLIIAGIALVVIVVLTVYLTRKIYRKAIFKKHLGRFISIFVSVLLLLVLNYNINQFDASKRLPLPVIRQNDIDTNLFIGEKRVAVRFSLPYLWIRELDNRYVIEPKGYSKAKMSEIRDKYTKLSDEINKTRTNNIADSTVIYVLSESFSDVTRIDGSKFSTDPIPNIRNQVNTNGGLMLSSGLGGGTANMEFETLTSLSLNNFTSAGKYPYVDVAPRMNYLPSISNLFKTKTAIHPFEATGYNRKNVFKKLGMNFISNGGDEEIPGQYQKVAGQILYMSDEGVYDEAFDKVKSGDNQFLHLITMQNHQPYNEGNYSGPEVSAANPNLSEGSLKQLQTYTQGTMITDSSTQNFLNQLSQLNKKVTVVFWGDHLPGLYQGNDEFNKSFTTNKSHLTDYFIWSNFETNSDKKDVVAPYNFTPLMLQKTNSYVSPYYAFETELLNKVPAVEMSEVLNGDNKAVSEINYRFSGEQSQLLEDYRMIQYDLTTGEQYLSKYPKFFEGIDGK